MKLRFFLVLLLIVCTHTTYAQMRVSIFYDSVWAINGKKEAVYFRNAWFDTTRYVFLGQVTDSYSEGKVEMTGHYKGYMKSGTFTFYYRNGQKKMEGEFLDDEMVGVWKYYYQDGSLRQTIAFTEKDFKVLSYHDPGGTEKVKDGDGLWEGAVYIPENKDSMYISGNVVNGLKEGWWVYHNIRGIIAYEEKYRKGKFLVGKKYSKFGKYTAKSEEPIRKKIFVPDKLRYTEKFTYALNVKQSDYPYLKFLPDEKTIYLDKNGQLCEQQQAKYYRQTNEINIKNPSGYLTDYYMNGNMYRSGEFIYGKKHGAFVYYHENGKIESKGKFAQDEKKGKWHYYYPDGSLMKIIHHQDGQSLVYSYWDEDGVQQTFRGTGYYQTVQEYVSGTLREEGNLVDYKKTGSWKGYTPEVKLFYEELYEEGKLIEGHSYDVEGNKVKYKERILQAGPAEGINEFYYFVNQRIKYPTQARSNNIQGKVFIQFVISAEGTLHHAQAISSPHTILSEEALRVVNLYDKWKAGQEMGQAVEMTFILSINFSISEYTTPLFN
jgi:TonB family protein